MFWSYENKDVGVQIDVPLFGAVLVLWIKSSSFLSFCAGGESTPPRLCSEDAIHATTIHVIPNHSETKSIIFSIGEIFQMSCPIESFKWPWKAHKPPLSLWFYIIFILLFYLLKLFHILWFLLIIFCFIFFIFWIFLGVDVVYLESWFYFFKSGVN